MIIYDIPRIESKFIKFRPKRHLSSADESEIVVKLNEIIRINVEDKTIFASGQKFR